jgi:PAS domain S-box-containing protein
MGYKFQKSRPTIGVLINQYEGRYQLLLCRGLMDFAEQKDVNLVFFVGRALKPPYEEDLPHNAIYQLVNPERLDGLIVASGAICNYLNQKELLDFYKPFRSIPTVSISLPIEGIPSILVDNKAGMRETMSHLIQVHGYRRIVFIRGPQTNLEAEERFAAYKEVLKEYNIPFDNKIVFQGDFSFRSGTEIAKMILDEKKFDFDAIVASNDDMAYAVFRLFKANGIRIPEDVALTGYDDIEEIQFFSPPFTTVRQPLYEQSYKAGEIILDKLEGKDVPLLHKLSTKLVIRESCGCFPLTFHEAKSKPKSGVFGFNGKNYNFEYLSDALEHIISEKLDYMVEEITHYIQVPYEKKKEMFRSVKNLIDIFIFDLKTQKKPEMFILVLNETLNQQVTSNEEASVWQEVLFFMRNTLLGYISDNQLKFMAESLFQKAQILMGKVMQRKAAYKKLQMDNFLWDLRNVVNKIHATLETNQLINTIAHQLPVVDIASCYIAFYEKGEESFPALPERSKLIMAYNEKGILVSESNSIPFLSREILPLGMTIENRRHTFLVQPLFNRQEHFGYIVFEMTAEEPLVYEMLREQISNALQTAFLFEERKEGEKKLGETLENLKESEERFREMAILLPTIILETDSKLKVEFVNQAGMDVLEISAKDMEHGVNLLDYVSSEDGGTVKEYSLRILQGELSNFKEFRLLSKKGDSISLLSKGIPIYHGNEIRGIRWNAIDIRPLMSSVIVPEESFFNEYKFTPREKEVILLLMQGYKIKEISKKLFITESTVKGHITFIYSRVGVKGKEEFFEVLKNYEVNRFGYQSFIFSLLNKLVGK